MKRKIYKFKNGATLLYKRRKLCNATSLVAGFFCGHKYENNGLPHLFEHMMMKGTTKRTYDQIIEDKTNISFLNAYTNDNMICTTIYQSNKKLEEIFEFSSDILFNSTFDQENKDSEVNVIMEEKTRWIDQCTKNISQQHYCFLRSSEGSIQQMADRMFGNEDFLKSITKEDFINYKNKHFVPNKFIASVTTSLPFGKIKKLIKKYYINNLKQPNEESILPPLSYTIDAKQSINIIKSESQGLRVIVSIKNNVEKGCYRFDYNLDCLNERLDHKTNSLKQTTRKNGLTYSCESAIDYNKLEDTMWVGASFSTRTLENMEQILSIFGDSIKQLKKDGLSEQEIALFKENCKLVRDKRMPVDYIESSDNFIRHYHKYGDEKPKTNKEIDKLRDKITTQSIKETINKMYNPENDLHITIMGNIDESKLKTIEEYKKLIFKD